MKKFRSQEKQILLVAALLITQFVGTTSIFAQEKDVTALGATPSYVIFDLGVVVAGDSASQGFGVSTNGIAVGRSVRTGGAQAFSWANGNLVGLTNLAARPFCVANAATGSSTVVGTCSTTLFGTSRLPTIWQNGVVSQLPLPAGETLGDAFDVNATGIAVGSINGGSLQRGVIYNGASATVITQTTANGSFMTTAFGINDSGLIVGNGIDPNNAARNVGIAYQNGASVANDIGALAGNNGALAFAVGNGGHVVGSSMLNQGSGLPFIWTQAGGMVAIPLPVGTTQGSARGVNSTGKAVGTASSAFAIPFYYDGTNTFRLADLIPAGTGWDLSTNTSSSALGISDSGVIVGTGVLNGAVRGYAMVPAGNVSIGGRVTTAAGNGIRNAVITLTGGSLPSPVIARTSSFGYYRFPTVAIGGPYTLTITTKNFTFPSSSRQVTAVTNVNDADFTALP